MKDLFFFNLLSLEPEEVEGITKKEIQPHWKMFYSSETEGKV